MPRLVQRATGIRFCGLGLLLAARLPAEVSLYFLGLSGALTQLSAPGESSGTNGLLWGIVVDARGDGISHLTVALDEARSLNDSEPFSAGDYYFHGGTTGTMSAGADTGPGAPFTSGPIEPYAIPAIPSGARFALIWFEAGVQAGDPLLPGTRYGLLEHPDFVLPADGATIDFSPLFTGPDPVRPADRTVSVLPPSDLATSVIRVDPGGGAPVVRHLAQTFTAHETTLAAVTVSLQTSTTLEPG